MYTDGENTVFTIQVVVKNEKFKDLLDAIFECNVGRWLTMKAPEIVSEARSYRRELNIQDLIMLGGSLPCYDSEQVNGNEHDEKIGDLSLSNIRAALQAMANGKDLEGNDGNMLKTYFDDFVRGRDKYNNASIITQIAVMGKIVYWCFPE